MFLLDREDRKLQMLSSMSIYMKALLRVSGFVVEKRSYISVLPRAQTLHRPVTLWHLETLHDSLSRRKRRPKRSGAGGSLLEASKIPGRCRGVFYVIMWTWSSLTSVTFTSTTLCPFLNLFFLFFHLYLKIYGAIKQAATTPLVN